MKRKWIWGLAALPLVVGLFVAKRLADKRPRLVARNIDGTNLLVATDGEWLFAKYNDSTSTTGRVIGFDGKLLEFARPSDSRLCVLASIAALYRINVDRESRKKSEATLEELSFYTGESNFGATENPDKERFIFPGRDEDLYGVCVRGREIIVESRLNTWHLDAKNLHIISVQKRNRSLSHATLCPDGKTLFHDLDSAKGIYEFADIETAKPLWKRQLGALYNLRFSLDGRLLITSKNGLVIARDVRSGTEKWRLLGPQSPYVALSPDQSAIYETRANGELWKWPR